MTLQEGNIIKIFKLGKGHNKGQEDSNRVISRSHQYNSLKLTKIITMNHRIVQKLNKRQDQLQMIKNKIILTFIITLKGRKTLNRANKIL